MIPNKRLYIVLGNILLLLSIPYIAMNLTPEVNWSTIDFVIAGILLFFLFFSVDIYQQKVKRNKYKLYLNLGIFSLFLVVWVDLAVGIF